MTIDKAGTVVLSAVAASAAALTLVYIFGPSLVPEDRSYKHKMGAGAVGLVNPGNDCFINSSIQALADLKELKLFLAHEITAQRNVDQKQSREMTYDVENEKLTLGSFDREEGLIHGIVTIALSEMLDALSVTSGYRRNISANPFVRTLEYAFGRVINRRQQDAQEFLQIVLERLPEEQTARLEHTQSAENTDSSSIVPFSGRTTSQIECLTCHYKPSPTVTNFSMLSLNVPQRGSTSLHACFDGMLKQESIEDYKCVRCTAEQILKVKGRHSVPVQGSVPQLPDGDLHKLRRHPSLQLDDEDLEEICHGSGEVEPIRRRISRHTYISTYPRLLILHLSRSVFAASSLSSKNNAKVEFEEVLTLGSFDPHRFRLASVITHRGGHNSGHYETFRRQRKLASGKADGSSEPNRNRSMRNKWWRISDDRIAECKTQDVLDMQEEAYLLFYEALGT